MTIPIKSGETSADLDADIRTHSQDGRGIDATIRSALTIKRRGDLEEMNWSGGPDQDWNLVFKADSSAFFAVGYGASRRTERSERTDIGSRQKTSFARAQRLQSLFEEDYTLVPMESWAPRWSAEHPDRFQQVVEVINRIIGGGHYKFTGRLIGSEYEFDKNTLKIPFWSLSPMAIVRFWMVSGLDIPHVHDLAGEFGTARVHRSGTH